MGDMIDRGKNSLDVVEFVMDNLDRIQCVNHELFMLDYYSFANPFAKIDWINGGDTVVAAYENDEAKLEKHKEY